jgi:hypothetical protein
VRQLLAILRPRELFSSILKRITTLSSKMVMQDESYGRLNFLRGFWSVFCVIQRTLDSHIHPSSSNSNRPGSASAQSRTFLELARLEAQNEIAMTAEKPSPGAAVAAFEKLPFENDSSVLWKHVSVSVSVKASTARGRQLCETVEDDMVRKQQI